MSADSIFDLFKYAYDLFDLWIEQIKKDTYKTNKISEFFKRYTLELKNLP